MNGRRALKIDGAIWAFLDAHMHECVLGLLLILSIALRVKLAPETSLSADYELYIKGWPLEYRKLGFVEGMGRVIGDYYVPFNIMYAIIGLSPWEPWVLASFFSCAMDYFLAFSIYLLMRHLFEERGDSAARLKAAYMGVLALYLPVVFMNSALWKQCDVFYVFFAMMGTWRLLKGHPTRAFILLGVSFAFKFQAIFFVPFFFMIYLLQRSFSILQFLWLPAIYAIAGIPAVLCRRGLRATYGTYFMQMLEGTESGVAYTSENYGLVANYPNLYNYGLDDYLGTFALPCAAFTLMLVLLSIVLVLKGQGKVSDDRLLYVLAWQIFAMNMFLPSMHERYDYGAVLMFFLLLPLMPRQAIVPAAVLNVGTFITYLRAAAKYVVSIESLTAVYTACFVAASYFMVTNVIERRGE